MPKNNKKNFPDDPFTEFYQALASGDPDRLAKVYIPRSDIFYIRSLLEAKFDQKFTLKQVEDLLLEEKLIDPDDTYLKYAD